MIGRIIRLEFEIILCQYRVYDEWDWFSLILRISVLLIIAAKIDIAHYIRLLRKKWLSSHPKPQVHYPMGRVGSRLSKPALSPFYNPRRSKGHTAVLDEQGWFFSLQILFYRIRGQGFLDACITRLFQVKNSTILTWTYHILDELKVVMMGNG